MNKYALIIGFLFFPVFALANDFDRGKSFGSSLTMPKVVDAKDLETTVPHYLTSGKEQYGYLNENNLQAEGQEVAGQNGLKKDLEALQGKIDKWEKEESQLLDEMDSELPTEENLCLGNMCQLPPGSRFNEKEAFNALATLKAVEASGNDLHKTGFWIFERLVLFNGVDAKCRKTALGYNNCCKESGWGQDLHLAGCNMEEKKLGKDRENKLCHYIGHYCDKKAPVGNRCLEKKESYCCFGSVLARIVIEGAHDQTPWPWGDAEQPRCDGMSPAMLQLVDFEKLDLTDYVATLKQQQKAPSIKPVQQSAQQQVGDR